MDTSTKLQELCYCMVCPKKLYFMWLWLTKKSRIIMQKNKYHESSRNKRTEKTSRKTTWAGIKGGVNGRFIYQGLFVKLCTFWFCVVLRRLARRWRGGGAKSNKLIWVYWVFKLNKHGQVYSLSLIKNEHLRWHQNSVFITFAQVFQVFLKGIFFQHLHYWHSVNMSSVCNYIHTLITH